MNIVSYWILVTHLPHTDLASMFELCLKDLSPLPAHTPLEVEQRDNVRVRLANKVVVAVEHLA